MKEIIEHHCRKFEGQGLEVQRARAAAETAVVCEALFGGRFPTDEISIRALHQVGNKKTGLVMAHTNEPELKRKYNSVPYVFGDSHIKKMGDRLGFCNALFEYWEAQIDTCVEPELRCKVNEVLASIGQYLNHDYNRGCEILDEFCRSNMKGKDVSPYTWICEEFKAAYNPESKKDGEEEEWWEEKMNILCSRMTRARTRAAAMMMEMEEANNY